MAVLQPTVFKSGLNTIFMGLVVVAGSIAAWSYWGHHFWTAIDGPTQITLADIAKLEDPRQLPSTWVKVKFDKAVESEMVLEATRSGNSRIEEKYFIFQAGDRWVLACVPEKFQGKELSGQIWQRGHGLAREAVSAITEELKDVHQGKLAPFEFDATEPYDTKWKMTAGIIAFFAASGGLFSCLGLGGVRRGFQPPRPEEYGLPPEPYASLVIETPEDAERAVKLFLRDAGLDHSA